MQKNSGYIANHAVILQPCDQTPFLSSLFNDESNNVSTAQHQSMATNRQISQMRNTPSNRDRYMAIHAPIFQGMPVYIPPPGYVMMSHSPTPSPSPYSEQENDPLYRPYHLAGMRQKMIQGGGPAKNKSLKQKLPGFAMFSNNKRPKLDSAGNIVEGDDKLDDDVMYQPDDVMDQQRLVQYTGMPPPQMVGDFRSPVSVMNPPDFYVSELRQNNQIMENAQYMTGIQYPDQSKMMEGQIMPNQYQNIPMPKVSPTLSSTLSKDDNYPPPIFQESFLPPPQNMYCVPPDKVNQYQDNTWQHVRPPAANVQYHHYEQGQNQPAQYGPGGTFDKISPNNMQQMPLIMYPQNNNKGFMYQAPMGGHLTEIVGISGAEEVQKEGGEEEEEVEVEKDEEEGQPSDDKGDKTKLDKVREVFLSFVDQSDSSINKLDSDAKKQMFMNVCNMYKSLSVINIADSMTSVKPEEVHQDGTYKEVQEVHDVDKEDDTMDELEEISDNEIENRSKIKEGDDSDSDYIKHSPDAMSRVARRPCTRVPNAAGGDQEDLESGDEGYLDKEKQVNVCNFCGKSFPSNSSLKVHTNLHTGNKPHICSFCKRGFGDPSNLKRHLRIHTRSRPYTCHLCPTSFNQSSHLVRHIRSHTSRGCHKTCRFCSASFPHYSNLRRHSEKCAERRKRENILLIQDTKQSSGESLAFKLPHLTSDKQDFEMPEHLIPHNQDKMQYEQQDLYNNPHMHHDTYSRLCNEKPSGLQ